MRHSTRVMLLLLACCALAVAAQAATISLGARTSVNDFDGPPPANVHYAYCGFSGIVAFSGTPDLGRVDCYVDGAITASGSQGTGFAVSGNNRGYSEACVLDYKSAGSGPWQTEDVAYTNPPITQLANGYADWDP